MPHHPHVSVLLSMCLTACSCGAATTPSPPPSAVHAPSTPTFEVHEWGLVRGTLDDHVMISGPHVPPMPIVITKPVLYFHRDAPRDGESALVVDVDVDIPDGRVVEHWPSLGGDPGAHISWHGVVVQDGSCHGSRYPTLGEEPCSRLTDGCEAATLASVETLDSDCLSWPPPPDDEGPTEVWNHLFYRADRRAAPPWPLRLEPQADGTLRVTATGDRVPGRILRVRRANGTAGVIDGAEVGDPPAPGTSSVLAAPSGALSTAADALATSLRDAGLTDDEIAAFRRAWDDTLFGPNVVAMTAPPAVVAVMTTPPTPRPTTSVIYVLPLSSADAMATLRITPAPIALRRAIVVWLDENSAP